MPDYVRSKMLDYNIHGNLYTPEMISACKIAVSQQENKKEIVSSII